jgi:hypothetical protein
VVAAGDDRALLGDLNRGYISRASAETVYGAVIAEQRPVIAGRHHYRLDEAATLERRRQLNQPNQPTTQGA